MLLLLAEDQANVRGTILVNPGGPGGAGTDLVRRSGKKIRRITGGSFNILGFDPRGIGASTPSAQCFDSVSQAKIWGLQAGHHSLNLSDDSVPLARAREIAHGTRCEGAIGGIGKEDANGTAQEWGAARFMSTASVATDMLKITEKLGEDKLKYWGFVSALCDLREDHHSYYTLAELWDHPWAVLLSHVPGQGWASRH